MRSDSLRRFVPVALVLALALLPGLALAQNVHVAIVSIRGKGGGATAVQGLQAAVQKLRGITFESARNFLAEAEQRGVADRVESDARAIGQVARSLAVDAVVIGSLDEGRRTTTRVLTLTVYNGGDGKRLGEEAVEMPSGKLTPKVFTVAARAIEPYLRMSDHKAAGFATPAAESPRIEASPRDEAAPADAQLPVDDDDGFDPPASRGRRPDFLRVSAGLALRSRTFKYETATEPTGANRAPNTEYVLPDGIRYSSMMAPGLGLAAEVYPLALSVDNALTGIGLTLAFEEVFLTSKQTITTDAPPGMAAAPTENETTQLETTQRMLDLGLRYRHAFGSGETAPEAFGGFGMIFTTFELEKNPEYRGTNYSYPHIDLGGRIPFGTPLAAAELTFRYIPTASMGDTTQELGADASLSGFGLVADLVSQFGGGFLLVAGVEYTKVSGDVSGEGRATEYLDADGVTQLRRVRLGKSVEDAYLGIHARAGYRF